ncbi:MAG TPA: alcohol dehydrogenase [Bryobacteraceae bacterium]|jgi:alcohol dehydrogenase/propanol-preferring alcohol dehydrogenase|nr:alcohol dehydrogenase [Bryobacteraceae bacterium]
MKAMQIAQPGGSFELVDRPIPQPATGWVRIKVQACGVCHSDALVQGGWPGVKYPRVPGHEVAGVIDEVGAGVNAFTKGQRVGVGWYGGHCGECRQCRRGDFASCVRGGVTGISHDGGYQEYMVAPAQSLAPIPDELSAVEAGPLMCAGITTFNALRHAGASAGDVVAVQAIGGLGHLGIQYARKLGFQTVAISRGADSRDLALKLGAHAYIDSTAQNPAEELQKLGGAKAILATSPSGSAMSALVEGLSANGTLLVVGAGPDKIEVAPFQLISGQKRIQGWYSGTAADSEDTLRFSAMSGVRAMIEEFPLADAQKAFDRMMSGKAQFRVVLTMS